MKLITYPQLVLRPRVTVVWKIPVFGMTPHSETMLPEFTFMHPTQFLHCIFILITSWQVAVMWSYFNWRFVARKCLPVTTDTSSAVFVSVWHISFAVTCGMTRLSYKQWSIVATWRWGQCCQLSRVPALHTIITTYTERTHSGTENEVNRAQQWGSSSFSG
jgi:hypothetical protein